MPSRRELSLYLDRLGVSGCSPVRDVLDSGTAPTGPRETHEWQSGRHLLRLLRSRRRRQGITLSELSAVTGSSVASLHRYETGERVPDEPTFRCLAAALGMANEEREHLQALLSLSPWERPLPGSPLEDSFLVPGSMPHLRVFERIDGLRNPHIPGRDLGPEIWQILHGLLIMGEHDTVQEVWPFLRQSAASGTVDLEHKVLIRSTLRLVKSAQGRPGNGLQEDIQRLWLDARAMKPGPARTAVTLQLARIHMNLGSGPEATKCVREVADYGNRTDSPSLVFLSELHLYASEFESGRSSSSLRSLLDLRSSAIGPLQSYNFEVAICQAHLARGDTGSVMAELESCSASEQTYGYGSPLVRRIREAVSTRDD